MGPEGLIAFDRLSSPGDTGEGWANRLKAEHVPSMTPYAVDPLGCGDALLTTATLAMASGGSLLASAFLGACAASCQAQRIGNVPISATDVRQTVVRVHNAHLTYATPEVIHAPGRAALRAS
jgi:bifunctional ADP-heptose synthase (sugar kinase/adenylyltransferase)